MTGSDWQTINMATVKPINVKHLDLMDSRVLWMHNYSGQGVEGDTAMSPPEVNNPANA